MGATGLEPVTPSVSSKGALDASANQQGLTASPSDGCTTGCTTNPEISKTLTLEDLAAALANLSPSDRAKLAAMLTGEARG